MCLCRVMCDRRAELGGSDGSLWWDVTCDGFSYFYFELHLATINFSYLHFPWYYISKVKYKFSWQFDGETAFSSLQCWAIRWLEAQSPQCRKGVLRLNSLTKRLRSLQTLLFRLATGVMFSRFFFFFFKLFCLHTFPGTLSPSCLLTSDNDERKNGLGLNLAEIHKYSFAHVSSLAHIYPDTCWHMLLIR